MSAAFIREGLKKSFWLLLHCAVRKINDTTTYEQRQENVHSHVKNIIEFWYKNCGKRKNSKKMNAENKSNYEYIVSRYPRAINTILFGFYSVH